MYFHLRWFLVAITDALTVLDKLLCCFLWPCHSSEHIQSKPSVPDCMGFLVLWRRKDHYGDIFWIFLSGYFISIDDTTKPLLRITLNQKGTESQSFYACADSVHKKKKKRMAQIVTKNAIKYLKTRNVEICIDFRILSQCLRRDYLSLHK